MAGRTGKSLERHLAFWDASALVPLCVRQRATTHAIGLYRSYEAVVWWATPIEIASALARLVRMKQLSPTNWTKARQLAGILADAWFVIQPSDALKARATQLVDRHELRAADALHWPQPWSGVKVSRRIGFFWLPIKSCGRLLLSADSMRNRFRVIDLG